jgi:hypothetical protein
MAKLGAGITNAQAKYLAALCREARRPYFGSGLTRREASAAIEQLQRELGHRSASSRRPAPGPSAHA